MNEKNKKRLKALLYEIVFLYIGFVTVIYLFQSRIMYVPDITRPEPAALNCGDMSVIDVVTTDGLTLSGWYKAPGGKDKPVILMFHGNAGNIGDRCYMARFWLDHEYGVLMAEYRGFGGNPGSPTEQGLYRDARAYVAWLMAKGFTPSQILLKGESLGTAIATQMATETKAFRALVLESAFTSSGDVAQKHYFYIPAKLLLRDRYDTLSKIGNIKIPVFLVHGLLDNIVPFEQGKTVFEAANEPKKLAVIPDAGHNDLYIHGAGPKILEFLEGLKAN